MIKKITFSPLGNKARSYRQTEFLFSTFNISGNSGVEMTPEAVEKAIKKIKKLGLNQIELGWAHHITGQIALEVCEREEIDVIWQDTSMFGGFQGKIHKKTTEDEVKKIVEETKNYKHLKGYYVWDEPWEEPDMTAAKEQTDWFDKYAPGKHAFSVMVPNYNPDFTWENGLYPDYVPRYLDSINPPVASFDYYPFGEGTVTHHGEPQLDNSNVWKDLGVVRKEAQKRNMPLWFYFQTLALSKCPNYHFSMTKLQINYALMYGVKCLQSYGLCASLVCPDKLNEKRRVLENDYEEGCFFDDFKAMVSIAKNLGKTFIALNSDHIYHGKEVLTDDEYFNDNFRDDIRTDDVIDIKELPFRCSVGRLSDENGNQYIAVLNRDYLSVKTFNLPLKKNYRLYDVSKADGKHYCINNSTDFISVTLEAGDMAVYRIQNPGDEIFDIEYIPHD